MPGADHGHAEAMATSTVTPRAQPTAASTRVTPTPTAQPTTASTPATPMPTANRARRQQAALPIAQLHDGVATRTMLYDAGLSRTDIKVEVTVGRWTALGRHTIGITVREAVGPARWWWAVWESGPGAVLDGITALQAAGLRTWSETRTFVSVPSRNRVHRLEGVHVGRPQSVGPTAGAGIPRTRVEVAAVRAARWATSDRQAATILAMVVQQRLVPAERILAQWKGVQRSARRDFLDVIIRDICDGAHSLGELDFAVLCRERRLPEPSRQVVRTDHRGRVYLDIYWSELGVHLEVNGAQHYQGLGPVEDALRRNEVEIDGDFSLVIPVLGLRLHQDRFMDQIERALRAAHRRRSAGGAQQTAVGERVSQSRSRERVQTAVARDG